MQKKYSLHRNQQGLVSIVVTMIIMIVLTLIVTGFAQLARREQREGLDRQLSNQAFYIAESGINDGRRLLKTPPYSTGSNKDDCATAGSSLDTTSNFQYTCLLIKQDLPELKFQNIQTNKSTVVPINPEPLASFNNLTISWEKRDKPQSIPGSYPSLLTNAAWGNGISIMRIDLVPASGTMLASDTYTAFLYPDGAGAGTATYTTAVNQQGSLVHAKCGSPTSKKTCYVTFSGLPKQNYYLRMKSIYNVSDVSICADNEDCDGTVKLRGAQAELDSTGRANDVLKRIQARVSIVPDYNGESSIPEYSLDSMESICKLLAVYPSLGGPDGGTLGTCP